MVKFQVRELQDIGGTLVINVAILNKTLTKPFEVFGCLTYQHINIPISRNSCLNTIDLSSNSPNIVISNVLTNYSQVLYPESGMWYLALAYNGVHDAIYVTVNINLRTCLKSNCEPYGYCSYFLSNGLFYSTCQCYDGFQGRVLSLTFTIWFNLDLEVLSILFKKII